MKIIIEQIQCRKPRICLEAENQAEGFQLGSLMQSLDARGIVFEQMDGEVAGIKITLKQ